MRLNYDKAITRAAERGDCTYIAFGHKFQLERGGIYRVKWDRKRPGRSKIVKVGQR